MLQAINHPWATRRALAFVGSVLAFGGSMLAAAEPESSLPAPRVAWTTSRLVGSPEPPLPYVFESAYPLEFTGPVSLNRVPHSEHYVVCEQLGRIYAFDGAQTHPTKQLCVDLDESRPPTAGATAEQRIQLLSLTFDPDFESNRWLYVCYITQGGGVEAQTHISRFVLPDRQPLQLDVASERAILKCGGGGHNGCTLAFGNDGYLYISIGDLEVPNPPDPRDTGQDISDLYASILRIDVRPGDGDQPYGIPADNPFVDVAGARAEVYAYGLRNPFRMSFDRPTGDLWVGDVGWEAWEMVYRVRPGGNYGWAIKEGPGNVKNQTPGPTPILPPDIALNHAEAASVTGGMVYRGQRYPDLAGNYVFGDWITRKFWAASFDAERVLDYREIAMGAVKPICFEVDSAGELLILDYGDANQPASIYRLAPNPLASAGGSEFPRLLSESGLFADTAKHLPAAGVFTYTINAPMWADGARAEYLLAIPGEGQAAFYETPQKLFAWFKSSVLLPVGSVLAKTYSLGTQRDPQRLETQIALKDAQGDWQYYTYRWNAAGTDAQLVGAAGEMATVPIAAAADAWRDHSAEVALATETPTTESPTAESPTTETLLWQFGSRTSCRICHTPWTGETIAFIEPQLRNPQAAGDSWRSLLASGVVRHEPLRESAGGHPAECSNLVDPADAEQPLDQRARSYLHTNCGHCHLNGGNSSTTLDISFSKLLADTRTVDQRPMRGDLGIVDAKIIAPGVPAQSILLARLAKSGAGRMPHIGAHRTDPLGTRLIKQWIAQMPIDSGIRTAMDELCAPRQANVSDQRRQRAVEQLLGSYAGAVELSAAIAEGRVPQSAVRPIVALALERPAAIRDLLEPYAAADQRLPRLGPNFDPQLVLQTQGDPQRGRTWFEQGLGTCSSCHRLQGVGRELGPDLAQLSPPRRTRQMLLQSLRQPSLEIDAAYRTRSILDEAGQVHVGRQVRRDDQQVVLVDAQGEQHIIARETIEAEQVLPNSMMPENLLDPLTAQQAADLLAYLSSLP